MQVQGATFKRTPNEREVEMKPMLAVLMVSLAFAMAAPLALADTQRAEDDAKFAEAQAREAKARADKAEHEAREAKAHAEKAEAEAREAKANKEKSDAGKDPPA